MRSQQIQMDLLSEDRTPSETLNYALARERGQANQQKMHNSQSPHSSTYNDHPWFKKYSTLRDKTEYRSYQPHKQDKNKIAGDAEANSSLAT